VLINHRDGSELIDVSGIFEGSGFDTCGAWEINMFNRKMILEDISEVEIDEKIEDSGLLKLDSYSPYKDEVEKRLSFIYPYERANSIPAKLSVSELKRAKNLELMDEDSVPLFTETVLTRPAFMEPRSGLSAPERGTVMHLIMQHLDFSKSNSTEEINYQINNMIKSEMLTEIEARTANIKSLRGFFQSPLGSRIIKSQKVVKEMPFTVEIFATDVYKELPVDLYKDEKIMLQGVIDCFFEENDNYILLDYKTDYVEAGKTEVIKERYRLQIDCYALALEKITGKKVTARYIYLFHNGAIIEY
jgi:ATP-dependent helicase/nuclease subunit A